MVKLACIVHWFIRGLIVAVLASVIAARAEQTSFSSKLSAEDKTLSGIVRLTEAQIAALDLQIQREIATAHEGNTVAFSTTFSHRRTPMQRNAAGLAMLTTPELAQLDRLVAVELTNRPVPAGPLIIAPATTSSPEAYVETLTRKMEVHGEVSLTYVSGSGGAHGYGASMVTTVTDPSGKTSLTIGVSQFYGKGFRRYPYYPGEYECDRGW